MQNKLIKKYQDNNPERFNETFIKGSREESILPFIKDILKSLEILDNFEILDVSLETDEAGLGPIRHEKKMYKSILPTRLEKIHFKVRITPTEAIRERKILEDGVKTTHQSIQNSESIIIERDLYINKLVDDYFYLNEGARYFLVHQLVDATTYGNKNTLSLKSLIMPISVSRQSEVGMTITSVDGITYSNIPSYEVLLFSKRVNPMLYLLAKYSYNKIVEEKAKSEFAGDLSSIRFPEIVEKMNSFFGVDFKISDKLTDLQEDGRVIFQIPDSVYFSVDKAKIESRDVNTITTIGNLFTIKGTEKRKKASFSYEQLTTPVFWVNILSSFFTKNTDFEKKYEKVRTMLISVERLMDDFTRQTLRMPDEDKINTLTIIRYIMRNFEDLIKVDNCDFETKRLRLYEYVATPLRLYFSDQIYRILNSPTRSKVVLEKTFSNLKPFYLVRQTVVSELLRYYNATNETNLYTCALTYTQTGPQAIQKVVSIESRDVHPSHVGRVSLVASNASNPGLAGRLNPFVDVYPNGYFTEE